jgi:prepilin-type N-terminal cleavage/methylation domain-containing protein
MNAPIRNTAAFTLLEMLVAMALVSVLSLAIYGSLRICFNAQRSAESALAPITAAAAAVALMRADLEAALPPTGLLAGEFVGEDEAGVAGDTIRFHACSGAADVRYPGETTVTGTGFTLGSFAADQAGQKAAGDVQEVEYALEADENGEDYTLVRYVQTNLLTTTTREPEAQSICRNVVSFNLRYLDGSSWVDSWDSGQRENELPAAVEVSIEVTRRSDRDLDDAIRTLTDLPETRQRLAVVVSLPARAPADEEQNQFIR